MSQPRTTDRPESTTIDVIVDDHEPASRYVAIVAEFGPRMGEDGGGNDAPPDGEDGGGNDTPPEGEDAPPAKESSDGEDGGGNDTPPAGALPATR